MHRTSRPLGRPLQPETGLAMSEKRFIDEIRALFPVVGIEKEARLLAKIEMRELTWRRYVAAESEYQQELHHPVTSRYGAERRGRATAAARERRDRYAKELGL